MQRRYAEHTDSLMPSDFVVRKPFPAPWHWVLLFGIAFGALAWIWRLQSTLGMALSLGALALILGALAALTIFASRQKDDLVLAAEFQNMLFASAAGLKMRFCLIVKQDGTIVYYDQGFAGLFGNSIRKNLMALPSILENEGISLEEKNKIYDALRNRKQDHAVLTFPTKSGEDPVKLLLSIDPLPRPGDFFALRARDFVEMRSVSESSSDRTKMLSGSPELLVSVLETLPGGGYVADPSGVLLFVTNDFEAWLGFGSGEMLKNRMTLTGLVFRSSGASYDHTMLEDFQGEVIFQKKQGSLLTTYVDQRLIKSNTGAVLGAFGAVTNTSLEGFDAGSKKNFRQP